MKDRQNRNARRKRLLRRLLRLAGLILLAAVAVFLLLRVVAALRSSGGGSADSGAGSAEGSFQETVEYAALSYRNGTATLRFLYEEGEWFWQDDRNFPLRQEDIQAVAAAVEGLTVQETVTDAAALADYELDEPAYTLTLSRTDGSEEQLSIGMATEDGESRYLLRNGDEDTVFLAADSLTALLDRPIYDMMQLPETTVLAEEQLIALNLTAGEVQLRLVTSAGEDGSVTWRYGNRNITEDETLRAALAVLLAWDVERCVDYEPSHDGAVLCGFLSPEAKVELEYRDLAGTEQTLRYTLGLEVPLGEGRCLRIGEDRTIFAVTAESADAVLALRHLAE